VSLINTFVSPRYYAKIPGYLREGDPRINTGEKIYEHFLQIVQTWGEDATDMVAWEIPSQAGNESFIRWMARLQRMALSPRDFIRQLQSIMALDAGDAPERIKARTLVMHVAGDQVLSVAMGRLLGDIIPGAKYVEVEGADQPLTIAVGVVTLPIRRRSQGRRVTERPPAIVGRSIRRSAWWRRGSPRLAAPATMFVSMSARRLPSSSRNPRFRRSGAGRFAPEGRPRRRDSGPQFRVPT
jgi:hypothetical protein